MINMPQAEKDRFEQLVGGEARRFGLDEEEYLRKVWYHDQAAKVGEFLAMHLLDELLALVQKRNATATEL